MKPGQFSEASETEAIQTILTLNKKSQKILAENLSNSKNLDSTYRELARNYRTLAYSLITLFAFSQVPDLIEMAVKCGNKITLKSDSDSRLLDGLQTIQESLQTKIADHNPLSDSLKTLLQNDIDYTKKLIKDSNQSMMCSTPTTSNSMVFENKISASDNKTLQNTSTNYTSDSDQYYASVIDTLFRQGKNEIKEQRDDLAAESFDGAIKLFQVLKDSVEKTQKLITIALCNYQLGVINFKRRNYNLAKEFFEKSKNILELYLIKDDSMQTVLTEKISTINKFLDKIKIEFKEQASSNSDSTSRNTTISPTEKLESSLLELMKAENYQEVIILLKKSSNHLSSLATKLRKDFNQAVDNSIKLLICIDIVIFSPNKTSVQKNRLAKLISSLQVALNKVEKSAPIVEAILQNIIKKTAALLSGDSPIKKAQHELEEFVAKEILEKPTEEKTNHQPKQSTTAPKQEHSATLKTQQAVTEETIESSSEDEEENTDTQLTESKSTTTENNLKSECEKLKHEIHGFDYSISPMQKLKKEIDEIKDHAVKINNDIKPFDKNKSKILHHKIFSFITSCSITRKQYDLYDQQKRLWKSNYQIFADHNNDQATLKQLQQHKINYEKFTYDLNNCCRDLEKTKKGLVSLKEEMQSILKNLQEQKEQQHQQETKAIQNTATHSVSSTNQPAPAKKPTLGCFFKKPIITEESTETTFCWNPSRLQPLVILRDQPEQPQQHPQI